METTKTIKKDIGYTFITQLLVQLLGFISGILITRTLGPEGKGVYAIFMADVNLLILFFGLSINTGITYFVSKQSMSRSSILGISLSHLFLGVLLSLLLILFSDYSQILTNIIYPEGYNLNFFKSFLLLTFIINYINTILRGFFTGLKQFKTINLAAIFNSIFGLIFYTFIFIAAKQNQNLDGLKFILIIYTASLLVVCLFYIFKLIKIKPAINLKFSYKHEYKPFINFIIIGHLSILLNFFNYRFDLWVINAYCTTADVGYYSLAVNVGNLLQIFSQTLMMVLLPYFTSATDKNKIYYLKLFSKINFSLMSVAVLALLFSAGFLIPFVYGVEFTAAVVPFMILLPGVLFAAMTKLFAQFIIAHNLLKYNLIATAAGFAVTIVLDLAFIPEYGIRAASIITTLVYALIFSIVFFYSKKISKVQTKDFFILSLSDINKFKTMLYGRFR